MTKKILLIVIDQLRADCVTGSLAAAAPLPNLQALIRESVTFTRHYTVATPCGPSRASLLTGLYAMNHRSVRNGTPLAARHETIGTHMRSAGYEPMLFGYTDASADPDGRHPNDPDLKNYEGLAPGFAEVVRMRMESSGSWIGYLKRKGYDIPAAFWDLYRPILDAGTATNQDPEGSPIRSPARYAAKHSDTAYLTDRTIEELSAREAQDWFSLVTYVRPHPPLVAPAPYNTLYSPAAIPRANRPESLDYLTGSHPFFAANFSEPANAGLFIGFDGDQRHLSDTHVAELRAVYLGLANEVDHHIGRLLDYLRVSEQYDDTLIIVTADHGEMLGDQYMWGKNSPLDAALHIPLIIRDPHHRASFGSRVDAFTESIDIAPTLADWVGVPPCPSFDGRSLTPFLQGQLPDVWRQHIFAEVELGEPDKPTRFQKALGLSASDANYAVLRTAKHKYVHFNGGLPPLLYDLESDPLESCNLANQEANFSHRLRLSALMIDHRMSHVDQSLSHMKLTGQGLFTG